MSPDDPRHGFTSGYDAHLRAGETACAPCRAAVARYENERRLEHLAGITTRMTTALGTTRRLQALVALGYDFVTLGHLLGRSHDHANKLAHRGAAATVRRTTAEAVTELYERLSMTLPPATTARERRAASYARCVARKKGWVPPLAWDDIDDPDEQPQVLPYAVDEYQDTVDIVVVERILAGDWRLSASKAERAEVASRWRSRGLSITELERRTGWNALRYYTPDRRAS